MDRVSDEWLDKHVETCAEYGTLPPLTDALRELQRWRQVEKLLREAHENPIYGAHVAAFVRSCLREIDKESP